MTLRPLGRFNLRMSSNSIFLFTGQLFYELDNFTLRNRIKARLDVDLDEKESIIFSIELGQTFLERL